ncbi:hypothetical protein PV318_00615 [Streptomyces sp. ME02-6991-2B]|nr:hypothetical protein [Streptomyces sp. ME02-6991-2B]
MCAPGQPMLTLVDEEGLKGQAHLRHAYLARKSTFKWAGSGDAATQSTFCTHSSARLT